MILNSLEKRNIYLTRKNHPNDFTILRRISEELIKQAKGVLHIGAHIGQEAEFYFKCGVPVLWFEGNPNVYQILKININPFKNQKAVFHCFNIFLQVYRNKNPLRFRERDHRLTHQTIVCIGNRASVGKYRGWL